MDLEFLVKERGGLFNTKFSGIDESDGCLLIGTNPRFEAALINSRLLRKSKENDYSIGLAGQRKMTLIMIMIF